jgi:ribosomal protein S18 acetylase RimI-like enzyme
MVDQTKTNYALGENHKSWKILPATWQDFGAVRQLEKECFPVDHWPFWDIIGVLTLPDVVRLKAVEGSTLIGFSALDIRNRDNLAWISTVCVAPGYRRMGVATDLIEACEAQVEVPYVRLTVRASNRGAISLYQALDYGTIDRWPGYYLDGEAAVVMQKRLR